MFYLRTESNCFFLNCICQFSIQVLVVTSLFSLLCKCFLIEVRSSSCGLLGYRPATSIVHRIVSFGKRLCIMLIQQNVWKFFKLEDDFGQVIRKTKVNVIFLFKPRLHLYRAQIKHKKSSLKNFVHFS